MFPARYFRHLHGVEWLREQYRTYLRRRPRRQLMPELFWHQTTDVRVFLDIDSLQCGSGFRPDVVTIGAIYTHRTELGLRALGARAILANPWRRETQDLLITRLEGSEFMPFAVLVNTIFNVHEEPIVNTPGECIKALRDGRIDFAVTDRAIYVRGL